MEEVVSVLEEIRDYLASIDNKLDELKVVNLKLDALMGSGPFTGISDIWDKLDEIKGDGVYNSLSDICDKLESVETEIGMINL